MVLAFRGNPPWLTEVVRKLQDLAILDEDWDSYGAASIDHNSIANSLRLITFLAGFVGVEPPAVGGTPEGHVGLSWDEGKWSLDVEVLPDGRIEYVYLDERDHANDQEVTTINCSSVVALLTRW